MVSILHAPTNITIQQDQPENNLSTTEHNNFTLLAHVQCSSKFLSCTNLDFPEILASHPPHWQIVVVLTESRNSAICSFLPNRHRETAARIHRQASELKIDELGLPVDKRRPFWLPRSRLIGFCSSWNYVELLQFLPITACLLLVGGFSCPPSLL